MPVIVIGADTPVGRAIVDVLIPHVAEVRAFVTDPAEAAMLRERGVKVATGDVSDGSHVGGAAMRAFCAIAVVAAAGDDRERSFAATPQEVVDAWIEGLVDAAVSRIIVVEDQAIRAGVGDAGGIPSVTVPSGRPASQTAAEVQRLEALERL